MKSVFKELISLRKIFTDNPIFGVEFQFSFSEQTARTDEPPPLPEDVEELDNTGSEMSNAFLAYFADGNHEKDREPVYSPELGLAIEKLRDGFTLQSLWEVIPSS